MKECTKCHQIKEDNMFYFQNGKPRSWCKVCENKDKTEHRHKMIQKTGNPDGVLLLINNLQSVNGKIKE